MTSSPATLVVMVAAVVVTGTTMGPSAPPRFIWNASESAPIGLYHVQPVRQLTVITLVVAYPPEPLATYLADSGYLPRGVALIKHVLALPGQTVCRTGLTITVDGTDMAARGRDRRDRPLPAWQGCRAVAAGEVFLMNPDEPASLDGRYFGPIPLSAILGRAEPALDVRDALTMQPRCTLGAAPLWGAGHRSSSSRSDSKPPACATAVTERRRAQRDRSPPCAEPRPAWRHFVRRPNDTSPAAGSERHVSRHARDRVRSHG